MANYKDTKVLITGGLGFIGSSLAVRLVNLGAKVTILDSLLPNFGGNKFNIFPVKDKVVLKVADLRDRRIIEKLVVSQEIIFNLAGTLSHIDSMNDPFLDLDINCRAQLCLLEACKNHNRDLRIVFAGTRNQYGKALYLPVDEKHIQEPTDINGINSIAAEKYHLLYDRIWGVGATVVRLTNTFGPRHQMKHPRQGVLNWFLRELIDNNVIQLYGDGSQIRDVNYVDDVVEALLALAKSKRTRGEIYNLGGEAVTLKDFVKAAIEVLGRGKYKVIKFPKARLDIEIGNYVADVKKIKEHLGWNAKTNLAEGIKNTFEYYIANKKYYW